MSSLSSSGLLELFSKSIGLGLRPAYIDLLAALDDPQKKLPPVLHVAGTNGKGSTCAFLRALLETAGYKVHVYTSPHLVRFHERIRMAGSLITEDLFADLLAECARGAPPADITQFEAITAAALAAFARVPADFTILEVGLGGRLDATNVVDHPLACLITRLSYDHRQHLGSSLTQIAREKAGIMRRGVPCFTAHQPDAEARDALETAAATIGAPLISSSKDWRVTSNATGFRYEDATHSFDLPSPALPGEHQFQNAGLAIAALLGTVFLEPRTPNPEPLIAKALRAVEWPARLQKINTGNLRKLLPVAYELWLDGGHNDSAGEVLARQTEIWRGQDNKPLHLICGMLTTKDPREFLTPLLPYAASLHTVPIPNEPLGFLPAELAAIAHATSFKQAEASATIEEALTAASQISNQPSRILICGSLYLAGNVLKKNEEKRH